ncbi:MULTISPECIES: hypothetical protein [unclassified Campylobacter]|uniref:hypothetical protein n=1 Tax=unclassified Campylobacter TaxID=2593542 RepID=UPI001DE388D9|nr:hypothetical protein [Campylobacter sp. RM12647]MBZ7993780.1 hypothetical protein [Campylobacter sp. RM9333]
MKKLLALLALALVCNARGVFTPEPTLNFTQARLYDECIKENNAKSCENYLDYKKYDSSDYLKLKESAEVAFKGCDELQSAKSCLVLAKFYSKYSPKNKIIFSDEKKEFDYYVKSCELNNKYCIMVGKHYKLLYADTKDKKDKKQALKYYKLSCDSGYKLACENYKELDSWWK